MLFCTNKCKNVSLNNIGSVKPYETKPKYAGQKFYKLIYFFKSQTCQNKNKPKQIFQSKKPTIWTIYLTNKYWTLNWNNFCYKNASYSLVNRRSIPSLPFAHPPSKKENVTYVKRMTEIFLEDTETSPALLKVVQVSKYWEDQIGEIKLTLSQHPQWCVLRGWLCPECCLPHTCSHQHPPPSPHSWSPAQCSLRQTAEFALEMPAVFCCSCANHEFQRQQDKRTLFIRCIW